VSQVPSLMVGLDGKCWKTLPAPLRRGFFCVPSMTDSLEVEVLCLA
jgi:hypothetical protein